MIKSITLEHFFSFREPVTITLNQKINILVGINGTGKSNSLKAIRFLYEGISGNGVCVIKFYALFEKAYLINYYSTISN